MKSTAVSPFVWPPPATWPASAWLLLAANLVPVFGVLVLGWEVFTVLLLFWLENIAVGVTNLLRMASSEAPWRQKLPMMAFFAVHYGGFAMAHGFAVTHFFGDRAVSIGAPEELLAFVAEQGLTLAFAALAVSHLVSFLLNDLRGGELRGVGINELMQRPYQRVIILHITILVGGFLVDALGSPVWALLVLVAIKVGIDLKAHLRTHSGGAG
ncbi:MAG: DUF6498-containing protein [Pseudomonadota bacterium]